VLFNALHGIPRQLRARSARMINIINARVRGGPAVLSLSLSLSLLYITSDATRARRVTIIMRDDSVVDPERCGQDGHRHRGNHGISRAEG